MDREILFRGKRIDNEEWIEGKLLVDNLIVPVNLEFKVKVGCIYGYEVIPETVGQYTGVCDRNGVKIFEGDIVSFVDCDVKYKGVVYWCSGSYWIDCSKSDDEEDEDFSTLFHAYTHNAKVIGNIHDNPELLEEENETD